MIISKQAWIDKCIKDLKGKSINELKFVNGPDKTYLPFFHQDDNTIISSPPVRAHSVLMAETIIVEDAKNSNRALKKALERGVDAPQIIISSTCTPDDLEQLLSGIELDFIHPLFFVSDKDLSIKISQLFKNNVKDIERFQGGIINLASPFRWGDRSGFKNIKTIYLSYKDLNLEDQLTNILKKVIDIYTQTVPENRSDLNTHFVINLRLSKDFYNSICHLRALRILLAHVLKSFGLNTDLSFDISVNHHVGAPKTEGIMLIEAAHTAMMGLLGGVDRLDLTIDKNALDKHGAQFLNHVSRNMHHIFNYESQITGLNDPALGSYAFDKITEDIAASQWRKL